MKKRSGRPRNEHFSASGPIFLTRGGKWDFPAGVVGIRYTIKSTIAKFLAISEFDYYVLYLFHFYSSHDF